MKNANEVQKTIFLLNSKEKELQYKMRKKKSNGRHYTAKKFQILVIFFK